LRAALNVCCACEFCWFAAHVDLLNTDLKQVMKQPAVETIGKPGEAFLGLLLGPLPVGQRQAPVWMAEGWVSSLRSVPFPLDEGPLYVSPIGRLNPWLSHTSPCPTAVCRPWNIHEMEMSEDPAVP